MCPSTLIMAAKSPFCRISCPTFCREYLSHREIHDTENASKCRPACTEASFRKRYFLGSVLGHDISHNGHFLRPFLVVQFHSIRLSIDALRSSMLAVSPPASSLISMMGLDACAEPLYLISQTVVTSHFVMMSFLYTRSTGCTQEERRWLWIAVSRY